MQDQGPVTSRGENDVIARLRSPSPSPTTIRAGAAQSRARLGSMRKLTLATALVIVALVGAAAGDWWWTVGRFTVSTDDAYVRAYNTTLAAKVSGYVAQMAVEDNADVRAGDVIATIDDGDYRLAVDAARDKVSTQRATIDRIGRQIAA
jgi:membrane fusion protein (multidrug efflux system)